MLVPRCEIRDQFLPADLHGQLLDWAIGSESRFQSALTMGERTGKTGPGMRRGLVLDGDLGPADAGVREALCAVLPEIAAKLGTPVPANFELEIELAAHRDAAYYKRHIDTHVRGNVGRKARIISLVYYLHRQPRRFSGGALAVYPFGSEDAPVTMIEPLDNRLIGFSSIAMHEVCAVSVPGDDIADARFAVNCWVLRPD